MAPSLTGDLTCWPSGRVFDGAILDGPADADTSHDPAAVALRAWLAGPQPEEATPPASGWRTVVRDTNEVTFLAPSDAGWVQAQMARLDGETWVDFGFGDCGLQVALPKGVTYASWRLDPHRLPARGDTEIRLLATELACASGASPAGRLLQPVVLGNVDAVTIALRVRMRSGDQDCQGNPELAVTVTLGRPLGSRHLFDGSVLPPVDRSS